ncbi:MAG: SDR family NAD(P)-dependent oxidoreductase [Deltaproteobacteria bacterium]|nr:SDR family NAD(P)-dependent oxidoreductase [Deltaproteobacteria bacterium]MBN2670576.1 SDR family NAD(P)-dependent oxidoreductase [Deltaproteobacteria bacterium]
MSPEKTTTRTALVTGGAGAIGRAIVEGLMVRGYHVTAVVRTERQGVALANALQRADRADMQFKTCDLSSADDIRSLAAGWVGPLHVLINNAATCPRKRTESAEGIEMQFAVNVLGYFRMIHAFTDILQASAPSRIVNVASYWAGGLDANDLEFRHRSYDNDSAYRQSKQANRLLTAAFAERLQPLGITVNSCHPGDVRSKLSGDLGFGGHETPAQGAATPLHVATAAEIVDTTGKYFANLHQERCRFSEDKALAEHLFQICESYDR